LKLILPRISVSSSAILFTIVEKYMRGSSVSLLFSFLHHQKTIHMGLDRISAWKIVNLYKVRDGTYCFHAYTFRKARGPHEFKTFHSRRGSLHIKI